MYEALLEDGRGRACPPKPLHERRRWVLYDQKWQKFLRRAWVFRQIPFVGFVLAAGSMATGNVNVDSDFDVIVGVREGRIFTARFLLAAFLGVLGWRRKKLSHHEAARDKICLNHFVTRKAYRLSPPHNAYWKSLYQNLVPVYGSEEAIREFFSANKDWLVGNFGYREDLRHLYQKPSAFRQVVEFALRGGLGDKAELILKKIQIVKIEKSLRGDPAGYKPRIKYGSDELEFHPDTKRIEEFKKMPSENFRGRR